MQNFFLIGYMGSGKTTIGKCLAENLGMQFIDLDAFIENRRHKTIAEIFAEKGESGFREIEQKTLHEVARFENVVISTGGGVPCFFDNMRFMNQSGITVYIKVSIDELVKRLSVSGEKRPLLKNKNPDELKTFISSNLEQRESFYNRAKYIYDRESSTGKKEIDETVNYLIEYLSKEKELCR